MLRLFRQESFVAGLKALIRNYPPFLCREGGIKRGDGEAEYYFWDNPVWAKDHIKNYNALR